MRPSRPRVDMISRSLEAFRTRPIRTADVSDQLGLPMLRIRGALVFTAGYTQHGSWAIEDRTEVHRSCVHALGLKHCRGRQLHIGNEINDTQLGTYLLHTNA